MARAFTRAAPPSEPGRIAAIQELVALAQASACFSRIQRLLEESKAMSFSLKTSKGIPLFVEILFLASPGLRATDCNQNGVKDTLDIASGTSRDCNLNSLPDECDVTPTFKLGAAESFPIERSPDVLTAADMDGDSDLDLVTLSVGVYDGHDIA